MVFKTTGTLVSISSASRLSLADLHSGLPIEYMDLKFVFIKYESM